MAENIHEHECLARLNVNHACTRYVRFAVASVNIALTSLPIGMQYIKQIQKLFCIMAIFPGMFVMKQLKDRLKTQL